MKLVTDLINGWDGSQAALWFLILQSSDRLKILENCKKKEKEREREEKSEKGKAVINVRKQYADAIFFSLWPKKFIIYVRNKSKRIHQYDGTLFSR